MIERSALPESVARQSVAVFEALARAEGKIHGMAPEEVHFHEVGAVDSLVDIVGACLLLDSLGFRYFACSPANVGSGTVRCRHGVLPVPAPATAELLRGFPVYSADFPGELITPTGAALLSTLVTEPGRFPAGTLRRTGYGAGAREFPEGPNALRLLALDSGGAGGPRAEVMVIECNLDDMNPELLGELSKRLLEDGALDVFLTPVQMKKFRPGTLLSVICRPEEADRFKGRLLSESSTFGVRFYPCRREELDRRVVEVDTSAGPVEVKLGFWRGALLKASPEFESCRRAAGPAGLPPGQVYREAEAAAAARWGELARLSPGEPS